MPILCGGEADRASPVRDEMNSRFKIRELRERLRDTKRKPTSIGERVRGFIARISKCIKPKGKSQ
jgi:hypothetical protein